MINYFSYKHIGDQYLLTNDTGNYAFVSEGCFQALLNGKIDETYAEYQTLVDGYFVSKEHHEIFERDTSYLVQEMKNYCFQGTSLHIFAVTNSCNFNCIYCQATDIDSKRDGFMSLEIGLKAIEFAMQSVNNNLTFEFQGGEPLLNFPVVMEMIKHAEQIKGKKQIEYTIVTNLSLLNEEILEFLCEYNVKICTSLDGNEAVHNANRPFHNGKGTYQQVIEKLEYLRERNIDVGAIETTTKNSLSYYREIIDEYLKHGIHNIFLRPLSPLGRASYGFEKIGYTAEEFITFYRNAFEYIMELNKSGVRMVETHATYFLKKMFFHTADNYMELRSPCGAGIGQLSYYYNGDVFTCDEGRMLSEMGDQSFRLGNVIENTYSECMQKPLCKMTYRASIVECIPGCVDCVYQPYCGTCPVINYAYDHDLYSRKGRSFRCTVYKEILDILFSVIHNKKQDEIEILKSWL